MLPYLSPLFSASLRLCHVPPWKVADAIAVPKPSGDPSYIKGYRPISLLPCIAKVLEHIVTARLAFHLEPRGLFSSTQVGFWKTHNIEEALWNFVSVGSAVIKSRKWALVYCFLTSKVHMIEFGTRGIFRRLFPWGRPLASLDGSPTYWPIEWPKWGLVMFASYATFWWGCLKALPYPPILS